MALPTPPPNTTPIINNPFYWPENYYIQGMNGPLIVGSGLQVNAGYISATGGGGGGGGGAGTVTSVTAGAGLTTTPVGGITTSGSIAIANTGVIAGTYTYPSFSVNARGQITTITNGTAPSTSVVSPITNVGSPISPIIGVQTANTLQKGVVQIGANISVTGSGVISVASSSTTQTGIVQLNDSLSSTSTTQALTAAQGKVLQDQISSLLIATNLTLAGTLNAFSGNVVTRTSDGAATVPPFTVGSPLPSPNAGNTDYFVIVTVDAPAGGYNPPGGGGPYQAKQGDWFVSTGTQWEYYNVGADLPTAQVGTAGIIELATPAEVAIGTNNTKAVTPFSLSGAFIPCSALTACGAILGASASGVPLALAPAGVDGCILTYCAASPNALCWAPNLTAAKIDCACVTAKGTLITGTAPGTVVALPAPAVNNYVLVTCPGAADGTGLCWALFTGGPDATPTTVGIVKGCTANALNNVALGCNAGLANPTGTNNTLIGANAGCVALAAVGTTVVGANSGIALTSGTSNTILGHVAGQTLTTGSRNVLLGGGAGQSSLTTQSENVLVGDYAGRYVQSSSNTAVGTRALCGTSAFTGPGNTAVGFEALNVISGPGERNTAIGYLSGRCITTACFSTLVGESSGKCLTTGGGNTIVGANSGGLLTTGGGNNLFGNNAGANITTGNNNLVMGPGVCAPDPNGSCQLALGFGATDYWLLGCSTKAIKPGAGIIDCAGSCGSAGQVLQSNGGNAIVWATPSGPSFCTGVIQYGTFLAPFSNNCLVYCGIQWWLPQFGNNNSLLVRLNSGSAVAAWSNAIYAAAIGNNVFTTTVDSFNFCYLNAGASFGTIGSQCGTLALAAGGPAGSQGHYAYNAFYFIPSAGCIQAMLCVQKYV